MDETSLNLNFNNPDLTQLKNSLITLNHGETLKVTLDESPFESATLLFKKVEDQIRLVYVIKLKEDQSNFLALKDMPNLVNPLALGLANNIFSQNGLVLGNQPTVIFVTYENTSAAPKDAKQANQVVQTNIGEISTYAATIVIVDQIIFNANKALFTIVTAALVLSKIRHLVVVANVTPEQLVKLLLDQNEPITDEQLRENLPGVEVKVLAKKPNMHWSKPKLKT